ncbi:MAG: DUF2911 domain-containing protein [Flavobacteriales bacterium]|nr:DUF2911 domain-containing protein [Flavobacteriales bacterium]
MRLIKWILFIIAGIVLLFAGGFQLMKYQTKKASPERTAEYSANGLELSVWYSSPSKKGRVIFGGLEPYGEVWRTGANEASTFTCNKTIDFGGIEVPAGKYTLWTIPNENTWNVILNSKMYSWGVDFDEVALREAEYDVANVTVNVEHLDKVVEMFTIHFEHNVNLALMWDQTKVTVPISASK